MNAMLARRPSATQLTWLWLLIGFLLLPFTAFQGVIPLAAWIVPVFLLRFVRTSERGRLALFFVFLAYAASVLIGERGTTGSGIDLIWGLTGFPLIWGVLYMLPYAADRLIGSHLGAWPRLIVFPTAFVSVNWAMSLLHATDTFGSPPYSQVGDLVLMQIASVTNQAMRKVTPHMPARRSTQHGSRFPPAGVAWTTRGVRARVRGGLVVRRRAPELAHPGIPDGPGGRDHRGQHARRRRDEGN